MHRDRLSQPLGLKRNCFAHPCLQANDQLRLRQIAWHTVLPELIVLDLDARCEWLELRLCVAWLMDAQLLPSIFQFSFPGLVTFVSVLAVAFVRNEQVHPPWHVGVNARVLENRFDYVWSAPLQLFNRVDHFYADIHRLQPLGK